MFPQETNISTYRPTQDVPEGVPYDLEANDASRECVQVVQVIEGQPFAQMSSVQQPTQIIHFGNEKQHI